MNRSRVHIHEVSPRDGLQNEQTIVSTESKLALIARLVDAGIQDIEVTSFVRPSWIPQLADAAKVVQRLPAAEGVRYWALVPNRVGLERALEGGVRHVATFMSASETHNQKNLNRTQRESLHGLRAVIGEAMGGEARVRSYISTVFGCPYEGPVAIDRTVRIASELFDAGASTIVLSDTVGMGQPDQVKEIVGAVVDAGIPVDNLALHMHDTRGTAVANVIAGLSVGITTFDGSVAGVGGCPYAPGAAGNAATEDLVQVLHAMGHDTGIDLDAACEAGAFLADVLDRELPGRMHRVHLAQKARQEVCSA